MDISRRITIHHLPDNTIQTIFELVRQAEDSYLPFPDEKRVLRPRWNYITAVCRQRRAVAINTKSLWSSLDLNRDHKHQFFTFLSRVLDTPIRLLAVTSGSIHRLQANIQTLATFKPYLRVKSLSIGGFMSSREINSTVGSLIGALPLEMPDVALLSINEGRGDPMAHRITHELQLPGLRTLHISAPVLDWTLNYSYLKQLKVSASSISPPYLLDTLDNCPLLEEVTISNAPYQRTLRPIAPRLNLGVSPRNILLEKLKTFVLEDDHDHVATLLQCLIFINTADVKIIAHNYHHDVRPLVIDSVLKAFIAQPSFTIIVSLRIEPTGWCKSIDVKFGCGTDSTGIRQFGLGKCSLEALSDFGRNLSAHSEWALITRLSIDMACDNLPGEPVWADILDTLPSLRKVDISVGWIRAEKQFFAVLQPRTNHADTAEMRCVQLMDVRITGLRIRQRLDCTHSSRCKKCQDLMRSSADPQSWQQCKCWVDTWSQGAIRPNEHKSARVWAEYMHGWLQSRARHRAVSAPISLTIEQEEMCPLRCQALQPDDYSILTSVVHTLVINGAVRCA